MKTTWHSYLEEDELGRGRVFIQHAEDKASRETYAEFTPAEMEDTRDYVEALELEAHVIANNRNMKKK